VKVIDGNGSDGGPTNGHDHDDPGAIVDEAVLAVEADDFEAGQMAALAADYMTGGQGPGTIHQARLQEFLWSALPRKFPREDWFPMVDGTARLLDKLGLERYAAIARSDATRSVLEAWTDDDDQGFRCFLEEHERSGITPSDTELIAWGELMGMEEMQAFETVSVALEAAIVAGSYQPGARGWRSKAAEITHRTLEEQTRPIQPTDLRRYRRVDLVLGSRIEDWVTTVADEEQRERRASVASGFLDGPAAIAPAPPPDDERQKALEPLTWLLEACRDGTRATDAGYLDPALVREAVDRFDWWPFGDRPRSEADLYPLALLHEIAKRNRWLLHRSKSITATSRARQLLDDPVALWWALMRTVGQPNAYAGMVSELVALRLLEGPAEYFGLNDSPSELLLAISPTLLSQGWSSGGISLTEQDVERSIHGSLGEWRLFGLLREPSLTREALIASRLVVSLSPIGEQAAEALLYARATARREFPFA
jgi:hypothetical protein